MAVTEHQAVMPQAVITDEMIATMAAKAGSVLRIGHSVNHELASHIAVTKFAGGIGDINPLWTDQGYATSSPIGMTDEIAFVAAALHDYHAHPAWAFRDAGASRAARRARNQP